jgi:3-deoxy-D-manno-octulosonate 8-phosphate phosphatase KdsC-like HAD superfamily phosphatase
VERNVQHANRRRYLLASDFDQTLSFNDSALVLSELLGVHGYEERVAGLARSNLIQQGGELAYLIRHDPEFRGVRAEHLIEAIRRVPAGYGKVAVIEELGRRVAVAADRVIYVGDGSSDVHVMLHVNNHDGFTIAVSENRQLARIARTTVLSDNAFSVMVPVLDQILDWRTGAIRELLERNGLTLEAWDRARTDRVQISDGRASMPAT